MQNYALGEVARGTSSSSTAVVICAMPVGAASRALPPARLGSERVKKSADVFTFRLTAPRACAMRRETRTLRRPNDDPLPRCCPRDPASGEPRAPLAAPRLREANRTQVCLRPVDLESLLPEDHRARIVWAYVEGLDLTPLYQDIAAVEGEAGRPATDPKILLALWLYATLEGVGAARALDRLCTAHVAYQWLSAGCP